MPSHVPQQPLLDRRAALTGKPVVAATSGIPAQRCIQSLKDFRYTNCVLKHTGAPDEHRSLAPAPNHAGRYHLALYEPTRPDAATDPFRRYAIQLLPWNLATAAPAGIPLPETRYIRWYPDFAAAPGVSNLVMTETYSQSVSSAWGDSIGTGGVRTFTKGCAAPLAGAWRHVLIETQNWLPAHLGVYEIPHDDLTNTEVVVAAGSVSGGTAIRGAQAANADRSWGSLINLAGRDDADGPEWAGRRTLFSFVHGVGLWLGTAPGASVETWANRIVPRDLLIPGQTQANVRPVWFITADIAGMELRWTAPALGTTSSYFTTGLEVETMIVGDPFAIVHPVAGGDYVHHDHFAHAANRGELTIHAAYLREETQP